MPDTPENKAVYPQLKEQKAGLGFPIARLVTMISLSDDKLSIIQCANIMVKNLRACTIKKYIRWSID